MQGGRHPFFNFGGPFGSFGGLGGFEGPRSLMSSIFGGRDLFDDPFFASPFGPMFGSAFSGSPGFANPGIPRFTSPGIPRFIGHEPSLPRGSRGPVIEELNSDDEESSKDGGKDNPGHISHEPLPSRCSRGPIIELISDDEQIKEEEKCVNQNSRKHRRSMKEAIVEDPNDGTPEKKLKYTSNLMNGNPVHDLQSESLSHSFCFQSSTVSYGGANDTYYTSSRTRRTGSDGLIFEECKEADTSTRQATHRVTRGIHDKGHSITRKLTSGGHVNTMQTLHNLDEDELVHFNQAWKGNVGKHLPLRQDQGANVGWALPSTESSRIVETGTKANKQHVVIGKRDMNHIPRPSGSQPGHARPRFHHQG